MHIGNVKLCEIKTLHTVLANEYWITANLVQFAHALTLVVGHVIAFFNIINFFHVTLQHILHCNVTHKTAKKLKCKLNVSKNLINMAVLGVNLIYAFSKLVSNNDTHSKQVRDEARS